MPRFPFDIVDPVTRRFPEYLPFGRQANDLLDLFCENLNPLQNWQRQTLINSGILQPLISPINAPIIAGYCPSPPSPDVPRSVTPPRFLMGGDSTGSIRGYYIGQFDNPATWLEYGVDWGCGENRGLPITAARFGQNFLPNQEYQWAVTCQRADGTTYVQNLTAGGFNPDAAYYFIAVANFIPCPTNPQTPIVPPGVTLPPIPPTTENPPTPQFPITIEMPNFPGLPDVEIPIVYEPVLPTIDIGGLLQLRPQGSTPGTVNPSYPNIDIDLGGISISGGGYAETIIDIEERIENACPNPCQPPEDLTDYERIRMGVLQVFGTKFTTPLIEVEELISTTTGTEVRPFLPAETIRIEVDVDIENYTGSTLQAIENANASIYAGWYTWSYSSVDSGDGERLWINFQSLNLPIPPLCKGVQFVFLNGTMGTVRVYARPPLPDA